MNSKAAASVSAIALCAALVAGAAWYQASTKLRESRAELVSLELERIAALLQEDQALIKELQSEPFAEKDAGVLESYLAKIRRDGVTKHADMKRRLDQLAENNTAAVTLIEAYSPHVRTAAFATEADKFRNYASAWRDRWNSVMEIFMGGGNYAASGVEWPNGFPQAVQAEIAAAR
jgi:hypothetical protein